MNSAASKPVSAASVLRAVVGLGIIPPSVNVDRTGHATWETAPFDMIGSVWKPCWPYLERFRLRRGVSCSRQVACKPLIFVAHLDRNYELKC